jgi:alpha-mannosidase
MVYEDAEKLYTEVQKDGSELIEQALKVLFPSSAPFFTSPLNVSEGSGTVIAFNTTPFSRSEVVRIPVEGDDGLESKLVKMSEEQQIAFQVNGDCGYVLMTAEAESLFGFCTAITPKHAAPCGVPSSCSSNSLVFVTHSIVHTSGPDYFMVKNSGIQLTIRDGRITSLVDLHLKCVSPSFFHVSTKCVRRK